MDTLIDNTDHAHVVIDYIIVIDDKKVNAVFECTIEDNASVIMIQQKGVSSNER